MYCIFTKNHFFTIHAVLIRVLILNLYTSRNNNSHIYIYSIAIINLSILVSIIIYIYIPIDSLIQYIDLSFKSILFIINNNGK